MVRGPGKQSCLGLAEVAQHTWAGSRRLATWSGERLRAIGSSKSFCTSVFKAFPLTLLLTSDMQIYLPFWNRFYILGNLCIPGF